LIWEHAPHRSRNMEHQCGDRQNKRNLKMKKIERFLEFCENFMRQKRSSHFWDVWHNEICPLNQVNYVKFANKTRVLKNSIRLYKLDVFHLAKRGKKFVDFFIKFPQNSPKNLSLIIANLTFFSLFQAVRNVFLKKMIIEFEFREFLTCMKRNEECVLDLEKWDKKRM
jgi:hypothetical protein